MIIIQTPLRISFFGGGTDFSDYFIHNGGAVLSTAINKYVFAIVKERFDHRICLNYSQREQVERVEQIRHNLVREAMLLTGVDGGIEVTTLADIPSEGTGLGSSSSITVALLHAFYTYKGTLCSAESLAEEACQIEVDILKRPIGKQDQYIAAYGNLRLISFEKDGIHTEAVPLKPESIRDLEESLMLFYSGVTRNSDDILGEQKANIGENRKILDRLKDLAYKGKEHLLQARFDEFGEALHEGWLLKRKLASKISNGPIEELYSLARKSGAIGGKITGAGGGGFLLLYCPKNRQDEVRKTLKLRELPFRLEPDGSKVIFNYRRS